MILLIALISLSFPDSSFQYDVRPPYVFRSSIGSIVIETQVISHLVAPDSCCKKPLLVFHSSDGKELDRIEFNVVEKWYSDVKFTLVKLPELPDSVIVAVAGSPGGSDSRFESTIIGVVNGRIQDLFPKHLFSNIQGAFCIERSSNSDSTQIVLWKEIWGKEIHYAPHRYCATVFRWNGSCFHQAKYFETKTKYPAWFDAAKKYGFKSSFDYVGFLIPEYR
jgi:hypothetical protein